MDLFSGGRAISENLQLNRELRLSSDEQNRTIPVSSVAGITIEEILLEGVDERRNSHARLNRLDSSPMTNMPSFSLPTKVCWRSWIRQFKGGTPLLRISENRVESAGSKEKYSKQLCLPLDKLSKMLGPKLISSIAITGSDPFIRTGTSFTVIFEAKQNRLSSQLSHCEGWKPIN